MADSKTTKNQATTQDLSPAELARLQLLERQRFLSARKLLRRRRRKSHQ